MSLGVISSHAVIGGGGGGGGGSTYASEVTADSPGGWYRMNEVDYHYVTATSSTNFSSEPPSNAFDNNGGTFWTTNTGFATGWVQNQLSAAYVATGYSIRRRDDIPARNPKNWTLQGSNNGVGWTVLDTQTGYTWPTSGETRSYTFVNTVAYLYYRLDVTLNNGDAYLSVAELAITGVAYGATSTALDSSGNAHHGAFEAAPTAFAQPGLLSASDGTSLYWNSGAYGAVGIGGTWMDTSNFSAEAWFKLTNVTTTSPIITKSDWNVGLGASTRGWSISVSSGQMNVEITMTDGSNIAAAVGPTLSVGVAYHAVFTWNGTTVCLYLNGVLVYSSTALSGKTLQYTTGIGLRLGSGSLSPGNRTYIQVLGNLDEVAIYPTALSAARVTAHFNAGAGIDDSFIGSSLDPAWTRHTVTSGAETWLNPGLQDSSLGVGYGYLRSPPSGATDFTVTVDMSVAAVGSMRGPWILDGSGNGVGACFYTGPAALILTGISAYSYDGTFVQIGGAPTSGEIRITKTGTSYTTAYSTDNGVTWTAESSALVKTFTPTVVGMGEWIGTTGNATTWNRFRSAALSTPTPTPATTWDFRSLSALPTGWFRRGVASETFDAAGMTATYSAGQVHSYQLATPVTSGTLEVKMVSGPSVSTMVGPVLQAWASQGGATAWYSAPSNALILGVTSGNTYDGNFNNVGGTPAYPVWFRVRLASNTVYGSYSFDGSTWSSEVSLSRTGMGNINELSLGSIFGSGSPKWEYAKWIP